mmetsp:Transcript_127789/g.409208  ORF Transcript_127789/g.409208 Transcript_127789/m.409208 type:complete len:278 (+) Transcript_127789:1486-2319(+)
MDALLLGSGGQLRDDLPEHGQAAIDGRALTHAKPNGAGLLRPLAARQVAQVHAGLADLAIREDLHKAQSAHRVAARTRRVHVRLCRGSDLGAEVEQPHGVRGTGGSGFRQVRNINTHLRMLMHEQLLLPRSRIEEVIQLLVVDLQEAHCDAELRSRLGPCVAFHDTEEPMQQLRDNPTVGLRAHDAEALAATCLAVGKERAVEPLQCIPQYGLSDLRVQHLLPCICGQALIEREVAPFRRRTSDLDGDLVAVRLHRRGLALFPRQERPYPHADRRRR